MLDLSDIISNIKKGQSALNVRDILSKLETVYQKLKDNIIITGCQKDPPKVRVYLSIPSESIPGIMYDLVLEFYTQLELNVHTKFKTYYNSPSFAYSLVWLFNQKGSLLWPEKYPKQFIQLEPKIRNPYQFIGFDKGLFAGMRYVSDLSLSEIVKNYNGVIPPIKTFEQKIKEVEAAQKKLKNSKMQPSPE